MKIGRWSVNIFKMKNRNGFAAICRDHVTEGGTRREASERMVKAINRTMKKQKKKK